MWAAGMHLYIGNFLIGIIETILLRREYQKYHVIITGLILILANYISMGAGLLLSGVIAEIFHADIFNPTDAGYIWQNIGYYISLTVTSFIVEYPFFYLAFKTKDKKLIVRKLVWINFCSAVLVAVYYFFFQWGMLKVIE